MKKILSIVLINLVFTTLVFAEELFPAGRTVLTSPEPNGNGTVPEATNQAGTTKAGTDTAQQTNFCPGCQDNNVLLSDSKRKADQNSSSNSNNSSSSEVKSGQ